LDLACRFGRLSMLGQYRWSGEDRDDPLLHQSDVGGALSK
jgi:hypothetical protein